MNLHIASQSTEHERECYDLGVAVSQDKLCLEEIRDIGTRPDALLRLGRTPVLQVSLIAIVGHWAIISHPLIAQLRILIDCGLFVHSSDLMGGRAHVSRRHRQGKTSLFANRSATQWY